MDKDIRIGNVYNFKTDIPDKECPTLPPNHYEGTITILDIFVLMIVSPETIIKLQNSMRKEPIVVGLEQFVYDMKRYNLELKIK